MPGRDAGRYRAAHLHQPDGWLSPGYVEVDPDGFITAVSGELPAGWAETDIQTLDGYVVPGMVNLHSHAHQRGLAGHAEHVALDPAAGADDFWAWRERMYALVLALDPEQFEAIAALAYLEMLKSGFTTVGEFHYLHHQPDGQPYADPAEMSARVLAAAERAGIGLTLLPALYRRGGIDKPPTPGQRRFVHRDVDDFLDLVGRISSWLPAYPLLRFGVAPHSLRAVSVGELDTLLTTMTSSYPTLPIHMHVAEQVGEVAECLATLGARPAEWLLANAPVDARWTFIHATQTEPAELAEIARRGVTVGLCPITEADLGDGLFALQTYHQAGGHFGIGTDGNTLIDTAAELRQLEYAQRLAKRHRAILVTPERETTAHPGRLLYDLTLAGGGRSLTQPVGGLLPGKRADLVELDPESTVLAGQTPATALDAWIFSGSQGMVRSVMVAGDWVVRGGHHMAEEEIAQGFRSVMRRVWASS